MSDTAHDELDAALFEIERMRGALDRAVLHARTYREQADRLNKQTLAQAKETHRLRAALTEIANHGYDVQNDDAYPLKQIARAALGFQQEKP